MSPSHNNLKSPIMNSYIVHVGEQTFRLYRSSITFDSPNFFTQAFLEDFVNNAEEQQRSNNLSGGVTPSLEKNEIDQKSLIIDNNSSVVTKANNSNKVIYNNINNTTSDNEVILDRDPKLFEVILRYLRGYNILPLSSVNLPPGISLDLFRENLLEDARFYGLEKLAQLLQAETPSPLRYKDPFTSADKILLSLRDVPIHKNFIKSKLEDDNNNLTVEFFTGAVLTIELDASDSSLCFKTEFLNEHDEKALKTLGEIYGKDSAIELSRHLSTSWNMSDTLNKIRLEIDGVQVTGVDLASLVGAHNSRMKALEDMFRSSGGEQLMIYAQEFVFRLDNQQKSNNVNGYNDIIGNNSNNDNDVSVAVNSDIVEHNTEPIEDNNVIEVENHQNNCVGDKNSIVYLGVVWAKGWTQEWWAWNEYRMKLDTLQ